VTTRSLTGRSRKRIAGKPARQAEPPAPPPTTQRLLWWRRRFRDHKRILALLLLSSLASAQQSQHLRVGQALYRDNCVVCHDIDKQQSKKLGPSFYQLFKRDKMPLSSMKPNRDYIKVRVKFGGPLMPAFRQWLSEGEIDTLIDYIQAR